LLIKTDQLTERQNQGNLMTQSYGSKVVLLLTRIARLPKSKLAGMTVMSSLHVLSRFTRRLERFPFYLL